MYLVACKMASLSRKRVRYTFDVHFGNTEEKEAFVGRLKAVRERLTPAGCPSLDNYRLICALLDAVEERPSPSSGFSSEPATKSFLRSNGKNFQCSLLLITDSVVQVVPIKYF